MGRHGAPSTIRNLTTGTETVPFNVPLGNTSPPTSSSSPHTNERHHNFNQFQFNSIQQNANNNMPPCERDDKPQADNQVSPSTTDLCFGWVKHPATQIWRAAVKKLSSNKEIKKWNDDCLNQVLSHLKEHGIERFFIFCDRNNKPLRQIRDYEGGRWCLTTRDDFRIRTMKRFTDDRKEPTVGKGKKLLQGHRKSFHATTS